MTFANSIRCSVCGSVILVCPHCLKCVEHWDSSCSCTLNGDNFCVEFEDEEN